MGTKAPQATEKGAPAIGRDGSAADRYIERLLADYGEHALPASEARRIVDASAGTASLTELLDESRRDGAK